MARMTVEKGFFETREDVMQDIAATGFWPTTFTSENSPELPLHHHKQDIIGYVMEGRRICWTRTKRRCPSGRAIVS